MAGFTFSKETIEKQDIIEKSRFMLNCLCPLYRAINYTGSRGKDNTIVINVKTDADTHGIMAPPKCLIDSRYCNVLWVV